MRIGILGALALVVFGVLFFRLWALQVLSGPQYLQAALDNQVRSVRIEAPRGQILDRKGRELVRNVPGTAVQLYPADLPKTWAARLDELKRLSKVLRVPVPTLLHEIKRRGNDPITPVVVRESVKRDAPVKYLLERASRVPGRPHRGHVPAGLPVRLDRRAHARVRRRDLAEQLKRLQRKGYAAGDKIGEAGVESTLRRLPRGRPGSRSCAWTRCGRPRSALVLKSRAGPGESIRLTLDIELQRAAEQALRYGITDRAQQRAVGTRTVARSSRSNPRDGAILAMASYPTYEPSVYTGHVTRRSSRRRPAAKAAELATSRRSTARSTALSGRLDLQAGDRARCPADAQDLAGRVAALHRQVHGLQEDGSVIAGVFNNWDHVRRTSPMTLPTAIEDSCDTYFYQLG